jgi:hypothetical protein
VDPALARQQLATFTAADADPTLTVEELDQLLSGARRTDLAGCPPDDYQPWQPVAVYTLGAQVVPPVRNEHVYTATTVGGSGTSGATEPVWPTTSAATVVDGDITWTEDGAAAWVPTFELNAAAAMGWRIKAGKVAHRFEFTADGATFSRQQLRQACLEMAKVYQKRVIGNLLPVVTNADRRTLYAASLGLLPEQLP